MLCEVRSPSYEHVLAPMREPTCLTTLRQFFYWLYSQHPERDLPGEFDVGGYRAP